MECLSEFYNIPKDQRLKETMTQRKAADMNHSYSGLSTNIDPKIASSSSADELLKMSRENSVVKPQTDEVELMDIIPADFKKSDCCGFVFVVHEHCGLLLRHCIQKKKKGPHCQIPGGHMDKPEFLMAAKKSGDAHTQLFIAAQVGAAQELYKETSIDMRDQLF